MYSVSPAPLMQVNCSGKAQRGGLIRQWTAPWLCQPACTTGASIKHRSSRCSRVPAAPCSSACSLAGNSLWARPDDDFPGGCSRLTCGIAQSSLRIAFQSRAETLPLPRDNVVQQYPSGQHTFPTPPPKAMAHQADFPCAPQRRTYKANLSRLRSFRSVLNPVPPSQHRLGLQPQCQPRPQMDSAAYPENHGYPASVHPVASQMLGVGSHTQRAAAIMSLIQSARNNGHDPYAYLKDVADTVAVPVTA